MDWNNLNTAQTSPERAFEAFCSHIFERWCQKTYGDQILKLYFLDGSGGDGGVEAFAELRNGTVIGLQAKWFRQTLNASRIRQIRESLAQAASRHPKLAKYIVVVPRDLSDSKSKKQNSEKDRWDDLASLASKKHPSVSLEYWGDTAVEKQLIANEDLNAFWFPKTTIRLARFSDLVARVCGAWFKERYLPDLHCVGQVDLAISRHLHLEQARQDFLQRLQRPYAAVRSAVREVARLPRLPGFEPVEQSRLALVAKAQAALVAQARCADQMQAGWSTGCLSPELPILQPNWSPEAIDELHNLLKELDKKTAAYAPSHQCLDALGRARAEFDEFATLRMEFAEMQMPLVIIGRPGMGKTHSLVACAEHHANEGMPVILVPARSVDPTETWSAILCGAMDLASWTAAEVLSAMEAATHVSDAIARTKSEPSSTAHEQVPCRALIVIDGLEESQHASRWQQRLAELVDLTRYHPRIVVLCATRDETAQMCLGHVQGLFHSVHVSSASIPLDVLFRKYCSHYHVEVGSLTWLAWSLRSPLAIRLFCELNQNSTVSTGDVVGTTVPQLLRAKIAKLEAELRGHETLGWPATEQVLLRVLPAIAERFVEGDAPLAHDVAVNVMRNAHGDPAFLTRERADLILVGCQEHGILDSWRIRPDDPLAPEEWVYRPAFNVIIDYLLADKIAKRILSSKPAERKDCFPPILFNRYDTSAMVVAMLARQGVYVSLEGIWSNIYNSNQLEEWQLRAIADLPTPQAEALREWVKATFVRSMPSCRRVLAELVIPSARVPGAPFAPRFADEVLRQYSVAARDLFWSGPDYLPSNHGAPWEGSAEWPLDRIVLAPGDNHDGLPLLFAWACTSLVAKRRRRARVALALWGADSVIEMGYLIRRIASVNDGQMVRDVFVAAAGAAVKCDSKDGSIRTLAESCYEMLFSPTAPAPTFNAITRHAARVVIERAQVVGCNFPSEMLKRARPPYPLGNDAPLPFVDPSKCDGSKELIQGDLEWYVAPRAIAGFFEGRGSDGDCRRPDDNPFASFDEGMLRAIARGDFGDVPNDVIRSAAKEVGDRETLRKELIPVILTFEESNREGADEDGPLMSEVNPSDVSLDEFEAPFPIKEPEYSPEAQALLARYAAACGSSALTSYQLRDGLILGHAIALGWTSEQFHGEPNGGKPGEVVMADIAVLRQYPYEAYQGARSAVATFREKYIRDAVNTIAGYLADRLPARGSVPGLRRLTDQSGLGDGMPEPFDYASGPAPDATPRLWIPSGLLPMLTIDTESQLEHAKQWLERAPVPDVSPTFADDCHFGAVADFFVPESLAFCGMRASKPL